MNEYLDMIVSGTGLFGGSKSSSSYNKFVKKYAKDKGLSIPDAAHKIKVKGLWKGTSKPKKRKRSKKRGGGVDDDDGLFGGLSAEEFEEFIVKKKLDKKKEQRKAMKDFYSAKIRNPAKFKNAEQYYKFLKKNDKLEQNKIILTAKQKKFVLDKIIQNAVANNGADFFFPKKIPSGKEEVNMTFSG